MKSLIFLLPISFCVVFPIQAQESNLQSFWEWTELPYDSKAYENRRSNLMQLLKSSGGGIFLCPSREGTSHGETFRQLDDFIYFTGLELPNSLLIIDSDNDTASIYAPARDFRFESSSRVNDFPGRALADDASIAERSGITIHPFSDLESRLNDWNMGKRLFRVNKGKTGEIQDLQSDFIQNWNGEEALLFHLQQRWPDILIENAYDQVARMRMIKSEEEIETMRTSLNITMAAIRKAAGFIKDGVDERTLEGELEAEYKRKGAQGTQFHSIIKSGPNSLWPWRILAAHHDRRNRVMENGDLVIFDVGCEYNYYTSDIGRTFPVSGKFSPDQKRLLEMEISVSDAIIDAIKPGVTFADLKKVAQKAIPEEEKKYMQVGLYFGHHIGLNAGDPSLTDAKLEPGMIFTVEPWYYNHDLQIAVFTEDVILVTEDGAEVLTAILPRWPEELEMMVNKTPE